jgi:hypothetical protein
MDYRKTSILRAHIKHFAQVWLDVDWPDGL